MVSQTQLTFAAYLISTTLSPADNMARSAGSIFENACNFLPAIAEPCPDYLRRDAALPGGKRLKIFVLGDDSEPAFFSALPDCSVIG